MQESKMTPEEAGRCCGPVDDLLDAELFKALSEPTRLRLLACLTKCGRPCSVTELAECCQVDYSVVSRHLAILERAGALTACKQGRTVHYAVRYHELAATFHDLAAAIVSYANDETAPASPGCHPE